jgi:hypothetical protein
LTPFRDALQVFSASLRKPARRYGYRGLKIFTSLPLRFQDFQRQLLDGRVLIYLKRQFTGFRPAIKQEQLTGANGRILPVIVRIG